MHMKNITYTLLSILILPISLSAVEVTLTYQDNSDNELGFNLEQSVDGENFEVVKTVGADVEEIVIDVTPGTYWWRVNAFNEYGFSDYTNVVNLTTASGPNAPNDASVKQKQVLQVITNQDGSITVRPAQ